MNLYNLPGPEDADDDLADQPIDSELEYTIEDPDVDDFDREDETADNEELDAEDAENDQDLDDEA